MQTLDVAFSRRMCCSRADNQHKHKRQGVLLTLEGETVSRRAERVLAETHDSTGKLSLQIVCAGEEGRVGSSVTSGNT